MRELSIFVDESGDFDVNSKHSPYYILTMVFHDQRVDISKQIEQLNNNLRSMGYDNVAVHTEPLIRREEIYENVDPNERRALFTKLYSECRQSQRHLPLAFFNLKAGKP